MAKPKSEITRLCKSCHKRSIFQYQGTQKFNDEKVFDLYNCSNCNTTLTFNHTELYKSLTRKH
jgi:DNA-directed RNA polymerase subunit M/transcription elongation factor TFIIS